MALPLVQLYAYNGREDGARRRGFENTVAAKIEVEQIGESEFQVRVMEGDSETSHRVTMKTDDYEQIAGEKAEPAQLVRRAIEMLFARERGKPIPPQCDLTIIARFFAQFERAKKHASSSP